MELFNKTLPTEFILLGFSKNPKINAVLFVFFFTIYFITLLGNSLMICIIIRNPSLHTPMYFFLCNLSFIDFIYSSIVMPRCLVHLLSTRKVISPFECGIQLYLSLVLGNTESFLLVAMSYDRYNAICNPLYYPVLMRWSICYRLVVLTWLLGFSISVLPARLCNPNLINHFACEVHAVLKLSCDSIDQNETVMFMLSFFTLIIPFTLIMVSYICILVSVMKMHSTNRSKAFSTCASHLTVVTLVYGAAIILFFTPSALSSSEQDKYLTFLYGSIIPMTNPIIYSLKNNDVKKVLFLRKT